MWRVTYGTKRYTHARLVKLAEVLREPVHLVGHP